MHTVLGDHQLLPPSLTPNSPRAKQFAFATVKVVMSWFIALGEYIPLTFANRTADNVSHSIRLNVKTEFAARNQFGEDQRCNRGIRSVVACRVYDDGERREPSVATFVGIDHRNDRRWNSKLGR